MVMIKKKNFHIHSATKKRKLSLSFDNDDQSSSKHNDSSFHRPHDKTIDLSINDYGNVSLNSTMPQSPWQIRRLKADLIESKGVVSFIQLNFSKILFQYCKNVFFFFLNRYVNYAKTLKI